MHSPHVCLHFYQMLQQWDCPYHCPLSARCFKQCIGRCTGTPGTQHECAIGCWEGQHAPHIVRWDTTLRVPFGSMNISARCIRFFTGQSGLIGKRCTERVVLVLVAVPAAAAAAA